jgi:multidrug transporter EmrE-like cation transporter
LLAGPARPDSDAALLFASSVFLFCEKTRSLEVFGARLVVAGIALLLLVR